MNNLELEIHVIPVRHKDAVQSTSKMTDFFVGVFYGVSPFRAVNAQLLEKADRNKS